MLFNTTEFVLLFAGICLIYYLIPDRIRVPYLLIVSYLFYALWNPIYLPFLLGMTIFAYVCGRIIEKDSRTWTYALVLIVLFSPLVFLKYYNFLTSLAARLLRAAGAGVSAPKLDLILPIGLSFYSFMAGGYLIDVRKGKIRAERNFLHFALFLSFFPQQCAGPIARADQLIPQFSERHPFSWDGVQTGFLYMLWGYMQKSVIADNIKPVVDTVFGDIQSQSALTLLLTVFLYTIEIYCDFAGYSNIALGAGRVMGYNLIQNFKAPYFAGSVAQFWRRWHISLTKWFTDYLYIPLGGSRRGRLRQYRNILIVFLVSGLWHGAGVHFVFWGLLNGIYQIAGKILMPLRDRICKGLGIERRAFSHRLIKTIVTFLLISFSWIFFRAESMTQAIAYLKRMATAPAVIHYAPGIAGILLPDISLKMIVLLAFFILIMAAVDLAVYRGVSVAEKVERQGAWLKILIFLFLVMSVVIFGKYGPRLDEAAFIYTQF